MEQEAAEAMERAADEVSAALPTKTFRQRVLEIDRKIGVLQRSSEAMKAAADALSTEMAGVMRELGE